MALTLSMAGSGAVKVWGLSPEERARRLIEKSGLATSASGVLVSSNAHVYAPYWLDLALEKPGHVITLNDQPVLALVPAEQAEDVARLMGQGQVPPALGVIASEEIPLVYDMMLRKHDTPLMAALTADNAIVAERALYENSYKGVTDLLTKYLWRGAAFHLSRMACALGLSPNMISIIGAACCVLATYLFWYGHYWAGMGVGLIFMVFDTVDGKLARCTMTSSRWGHVLDHGLDLIHPPFWWFAWGIGLASWGLAQDFMTFWTVQAVIFLGYWVQRIIEGIFMLRNSQIHIHVWQPLDSWFRLITARRNPNMVILFFATLAGRPDVGLAGVAWWTALSCLFHLVRLVQAEYYHLRGWPVQSWLEAKA